MRRYLLLLAICGACSAQSVEGIVEDSLTGQPIAGAHIAFGGATINDRYMSFSDRAGHFQRVLPEAAYQVLVNRVGYFPSEQRLAIAPGQKSATLRFQLTPQAVISGKLEDEDGFPVEGARVEAVPYDMVNGQLKLRKTAAAAISSDLGEFRIASLTAGSYFIRATPSMGRKWDLRYIGQYYPGSLEPLEGNAIQVAAGQEQSGVAFPMKKYEGVTVTGRVVPLSGAKTAPVNHSICLKATDDSGYCAGSATWRENDPTFTFRHVPPGSYTVSASPSGFAKPRPGDLVLEQEVQVADADLTDVVATFHVVDASGN